MNFKRIPVKIWLNQSLFPVSLVSIMPKRGRILYNVQLVYRFSDSFLKSRSGGDESLGTLLPHQSIDLFAHGEEQRNIELPPLKYSRLVRLSSGASTIVTLRWSEQDLQAPDNSLSILWAGKNVAGNYHPRLLIGKKQKILEDFSDTWEQPITGELLMLKRRVPLMRNRDAVERAKRENNAKNIKKGVKEVRTASISVVGFRGFREEANLNIAIPKSDTPGSGMTIVVGANNTGKSTLFESFEAIARKLRSDVSFSEGQRNRNTVGGVKIRLQQEDGLQYTLESQTNATSETTGMWKPEIGTLEIVSVPARRQFQPFFGKYGTSSRDWMHTSTDFSRQRQIDSSFTGRIFDIHNNPEKKKEFNALMKEVLGYDLEWTIDLSESQQGQSYYLKVVTGEGVNHTSEGLGDGIISLLYILNALYDSTPQSLLVFDEPELSLHPQLVRRLGRVFSRFASNRQIVIFTHSPLLVSWDDIEAGAEIARVYKEDSDSKIAQVKRSTIEEISKIRNNWRNPHVLGHDANEALFLDDGIIVVEGQEDAALVPRAASLVGVDLPGTIFGWGAGGGDKVTKVIELLSELQFKKVAVIIDNNVGHVVQKILSDYPGFYVGEIPASDIRDKPAESRPRVEGLLDEKGKNLKEQLLPQAKMVFQSVADYLNG